MGNLNIIRESKQLFSPKYAGQIVKYAQALKKKSPGVSILKDLEQCIVEESSKTSCKRNIYSN